MKAHTKLCLLFAILTISQITFAGTSMKEISTEPNKTELKDIKTGGWTFTLIVRDEKGNPISGATVAAPCTGQPNRTTDSNGEVEFSSLTGSCPCSGDEATITTDKGCDTPVNIVCNGNANGTCDQ